MLLSISILTAIVFLTGLCVWGVYKGVPSKLYFIKRVVNLITRLLGLLWLMEMLALGILLMPGVLNLLDSFAFRSGNYDNPAILGIGYAYTLFLIVGAVWLIIKGSIFRLWKYTETEIAWEKAQVQKDWDRIKNIFKKGGK